MKYIIVFGSLRKNSERGYNFNRFGGQRHIKDIVLKGYDMHNLGYYPAITPGSGIIKAELHEIEDAAFESIQRMEKGAGYDETTVEIDGKSATIFTMKPDMLQDYPKVAFGDWN